MQQNVQVDNLIANLEKRDNTDSQILRGTSKTHKYSLSQLICRTHVRTKVRAPFESKQCMTLVVLRPQFEHASIRFKLAMFLQLHRLLLLLIIALLQLVYVVPKAMC